MSPAITRVTRRALGGRNHATEGTELPRPPRCGHERGLSSHLSPLSHIPGDLLCRCAA